MEKRHNTAEQAHFNFFSKSDCLLPPPGEQASPEYLNKLRQLCYELIERIDIEEKRVIKLQAAKEEMQAEMFEE